MLEQRAFKRLDATGFTLAELSALYFSRTLVECLAATPFQRDVKSAFDKLAAALTPGMRQFLDRLPLVIQAKAEPGSQAAASRTKEIGQLLDATLHHRRAVMRYHSFSSDREKEYTIEPSRWSSRRARSTWWPSCRSTGAAHVRRGPDQVAVADRRAVRAGRPREDAFAHSLGVHQGTPERIEIAFEPRIAPYVASGCGTRRRRFATRADGRIVVTLNVSNDLALRSWILGFGPLAESSRRRRWRREIRELRPNEWRRCTEWLE